MNYQYINTWRDSPDTFLKQLYLNYQELQKPYDDLPLHWKSYLSFLYNLKLDKIIDIGCGCGTLSYLTKQYYPNIKYIGYDYSPCAIEIAKTAFPDGEFYISDYKDLKVDTKNTALLQNALLDVLPNADQALETILQYNFPFLISLRTRFTEKDSYSNEYQTPYGIYTYEYHHNRDKFINLINKHNYKLICDYDHTDFRDLTIEKINV